MLRGRLKDLARDVGRKVDEHEVGKLIMTIEGVGPLIAACLIAELGDPARFDRQAFVRSNREGASNPRSGARAFDEPRPRSDSTFDQNYFAAFVFRVAAVFLSRGAEP